MKLNRWILIGAPAAIAGIMLAGASFSVGGPTVALAGDGTPSVFACDATATPTQQQPEFNQAQGGGELSAFQSAPTDTSTPTCTPTSKPRTHTPTPEPTEDDTATAAPSNTPPPPPPATNTPTGGGAGVVTPPDTGSGDGTSGANTALIWLAAGLALAAAGGGAFLVGVRRRS